MQKRVKFDFSIQFSNGGGVQGQDFRLDIDGDTIDDQELAGKIVRDMRLLMVENVQILNKEMIDEPHKRGVHPGDGTLIDLSHEIFHGLVTYKGLPAPLVCDYLSREESRGRYAPGTEFQIGKIEMVTNTGTYIDCPFHRYADGKDTADVLLDALADLDAVVVRADYQRGLAIEPTAFVGVDLGGRAVLVHTGWDAHWNSEHYFVDHPFLTEATAIYLRDHGAALVGIDSMNIDDTRGNARPVHSTLLAAEVLIVEHLCNLGALPNQGFRFSAVPPKFRGVGTFPVRAFARI